MWNNVCICRQGNLTLGGGGGGPWFTVCLLAFGNMVYQSYLECAPLKYTINNSVMYYHFILCLVVRSMLPWCIFTNKIIFNKISYKIEDVVLDNIPAENIVGFLVSGQLIQLPCVCCVRCTTEGLGGTLWIHNSKRMGGWLTGGLSANVGPRAPKQVDLAILLERKLFCQITRNHTGLMTIHGLSDIYTIWHKIMLQIQFEPLTYHFCFWIVDTKIRQTKMAE